MNKIIGIDAYSALHMPRGMGMYTLNFLKELKEIDKETQYILYADIEDNNNILPKQQNFKFKILPSKGQLHYEQIVLPIQCNKDGISILHSPANTSPLLLSKKIKRIVTQHDIIFLKKEIPLPNNKKQFLGRLYYSLCAILNTIRADKIFTVSNFSKNDILETLHIPDNKITITPNGHEHFDVSRATPFEELKNKYKLKNKYYFTLGGEAPSKNTEFLIKYFSKNSNENLVIAGIRELDESVLYNKYKQFANIKFIPYIEQNDLVGIYKNSKAFIFPSIYEGFGIPLLEAMKCHCPILCSNSSCLPEIAEDAALYFNPYSEDELNKCLKKIADGNTVNKIKDKSVHQLEKYSWTKCAQRIYEEYKNVSNN